MKSWVLLVVFIASMVIEVTPVSISGIEVQEGVGEDEDEPIHEGDSFTLRTTLQTNNDDWFLCTWIHRIDNEYTRDLEDDTLICPATPTDRSCGGTVDSSYASRVSIDSSGRDCTLRVSGADPRDTGKWECHVSDASSGGINIQRISLDLYISNQTKLYISDPDLIDGTGDVVTYDMESSRAEVDATCRGYGGKPEPEFRWYVNDDNTEIDDSDLSRSKRSGQDNELGDYVEERISWSPSIDDLCDKYDLQERICDKRKSNKKKYREFNFNLICKADQGDYYQNENDNEYAEVIVEVVSSSSPLTPALMAVFFSLIFSNL